MVQKIREKKISFYLKEIFFHKMGDKVIVKVKSNFRYIFKAIIESMYTIVSGNSVRFIFSKKSLEIDAISDDGTVIYYVFIDTDNFNEFECDLKDDEENISQYDVESLYEPLKNAKKSEDITIELTEDSVLRIGLSSKGRVETVDIDPVEPCNIKRLTFETYNTRPRIVTSGKDFHSDCKKRLNGKKVDHLYVSSSKCTLRMDAVDTENKAIKNKYIQIGNDKISSSDETFYNLNIGTNKLIRCTCACKISDIMKLYLGNKKPMLMKSNLGSLGTMNIYFFNDKYKNN